MVVMAFMLFHVPQPEVALRDVRRVLRPGGAVGLTTWGQDKVVPALEVWNDELDRHGAPPASPFIARHELMDTPDKVRTLLGDTGYRRCGLRSFPGRTVPARRISSHDTPPSVRRAGAWPPWTPPPRPLFCAVCGLGLTN